MRKVMQGDSYPLEFEITDEIGVPIKDDAIEDVEIVIGGKKKSLADETLEYADGVYIYGLSQEETHAMAGNISVNVRVKFLTGEVVGHAVDNIRITLSRSKEVL